MTIKLGDISGYYKIEYVTDIDILDQAGGYKNDVKLTADYGLGGVGTGYTDASKTPSINVKNKYTKNTINNKTVDGINYNGIDYDAKTMSWNIKIDPLKEKITSLTITDTFPNNGMKFLQDTLKVVKGTGNVALASTAYTVTPTGEGQNGFVLVFNESALPLENSEYNIYFKTSFDPDVITNPWKWNIGGSEIKGKYINKASFTGTTVDKDGVTKTIVTDDSEANYNISGEAHITGSKQGTLKRAERQITWKIYVNYLSQDFTGKEFVIEDALSDIEQKLKKQEGKIVVSVKEFKVASDGTKSIVEGAAIPGYTLEEKSVGGKEGFKLTFASGINKPYVIEFTTDITGVSKKNYSNTATVTVDGISRNYPASTGDYADFNNFIEKSAENVSGNQVYTDDIIHWKVPINKSLSEINNAVFTDTISEGLVLVEDSLKVLDDKGNTVSLPQDKIDFEKKVDGTTVLTVELGNIDSLYTITYDTVVIATTGNVSNHASIKGTDFEEKKVQKVEFSSTKSSGGSGSGVNKGSITIKKVDSEGNIIKHGAKFELYYLLNNNKQIVGGEQVTTSNGEYKFEGLPFRTYYLKEVEAPKGYFLLNDEIEIILSNGSGQKDKVIEVENTKIKTSITAIKIWQDGPAKPTILLTLYRQIGSGVKEVVNTVSLLPGTTAHTWTDLDKTDMEGNEYLYTVDEADVPGYVKSIQVNGNIVTITNTFEIKKADITAKKVWDGGSSPKPNIKLQLFRNGLAYQNSVTLVNGDTEHTWFDLDLYNTFGVPFEYMVREVEIGGSPVTEGKTVNNYKYEGVTVDGDGKFVITNTYVSPKTNITGTKKWEKGPDEKPTIELQLYRQIEGGTKQAIGSKATLVNGTTLHTWTDLDVTDKNGNVYTYTVDEVNVPANYTKVADGLTVTNTYVSPKINVTGNKVWVGGPTPRPTIELQLYRDGDAFGEPVELKNGETSYTWKNLNKTDENGKDYIYSIDEVATPENYGKSKSGDGLTITNTYKSPKDDITGRKVWVGGPKPSIQLQLYRQIVGGNKEAVGSPVTLDSGVYVYTWESQDKTDNNGNVYNYTVEEIGKPANYNKTEEGLTVTNTYVIPKTQVTGTKEWVNGPAEKPTIELQLYKDGDAFGEPVEIKDGTLTYTWTDLDETDINGKKYVYTVDEVNVPNNYEKSVDGLKITNTYVIPKKNVTGTKVWDGGPKPAIQIQLYRDGVAFGEPVTLENEVTEYTWYDLNVTDINGNVYTYTIEEIGVPDNYTKTEEGLTVTNTYVIPKTNITGTKEWVGGPSTKPTIQLQLYRDGTAYGEPVTLENGTTTYTWENLDETDYEGNEYVYTIDEVEVPRRYRKSISDDGLTIRNRYNPPTRPTDPGEPEEPKEPENPEVPEKPEIPEEPEKPEKPEEPETPTEPEKPVVDSKDKLGNILINKLDLDSNPLEGAKFTLYDQSGTAIKTVTSDVNGTVLFSDF